MDRDRDEWRQPWTEPDAGAAVDLTDEHDAVVRPHPLPPPTPWDTPDAMAEPARRTITAPDTAGSGPRGRGGRGVVSVVLIALFGAVVGTAGTLAVVGVGGGVPSVSGPDVPAPIVQANGADDRGLVPAVASAVLPSVVRIDVAASSSPTAQPIALGSGVIYRSDGYIITNNHVIEQGGFLTVKLSDGTERPAEVIGTDPRNDLAVLKIDSTGLPAVNLRLDDPPVVGELAIAIGSPFGLDASVTVGVVSATGRDIRVTGEGGVATVISPVLQTDAAINPGNSGGALVDSSGRLLGINTAILTQTGGSQGVGFAIPVGQAVTSADQLIETGEVQYPLLGVLGGDVTPEMAERLGLEDRRGAVLTDIVPGSGAAEAGLEVDDVVIAVEGRAIESMTDLVVAIRRHQPGDTIDITFLRDGSQQTVAVTLGEAPLEQ